MALKPCRECARPVSTEAGTCIHCGCPNPTRVGYSASVPPVRATSLQMIHMAACAIGLVSTGLAYWLAVSALHFDFPWWCYLIFFIVMTGSMSNQLTKQAALKKIVQGD